MQELAEAHETALGWAERLAMPGPLWTVQRRPLKLPDQLPATAMHESAEAQDTPVQVEPCGKAGRVVAAQPCPFQRSTSASSERVPPSPTATHVLVLVHEMPSSWAANVPPRLDGSCSDHLWPFHRSPRGYRVRLRSKYPTARQRFCAGQETPLKTVLASVSGIRGVATIDHRPPFQCSVSALVMSPWRTVSPTAMHEFADAHEIALMEFCACAGEGIDWNVHDDAPAADAPAPAWPDALGTASASTVASATDMTKTGAEPRSARP